MTDVKAHRAYWHPIARSADIQETPQPFMLLEERLVAFRTASGVSVFKDLCIHRGSALSLGRVIDDSIECPYHGWRYGPDGACVRIPSLPEGSTIPVKARAISYDARQAFGLVWVALEPPLAPFPDFLDEYAADGPGFRLAFVDQYDWNVDAGRAVENFLDVAHFPFIHENTLGTRDHTVVSEHSIQADDYSMRYTYLQEEPADPSTGVGEIMALKYFYRAPYTVHLQRQTPHADFSVFSLFASPTTRQSSRLFVTFGRNFDLDPESDARYIAFSNMVMCQDKAVVESVHPEEIPVDLREELHIKVPDAAGLTLRRILGRIEGSAVPVA